MKGIFTAPGKLFGQRSAGQRSRRPHGDLSRMSDRTLRDIGLTRDDLPFVRLSTHHTVI